MQEKEGERALGVSEVTSLTVMRDARGHRGILKSWFHNKWWFCFFSSKVWLTALFAENGRLVSNYRWPPWPEKPSWFSQTVALKVQTHGAGLLSSQWNVSKWPMWFQSQGQRRPEKAGMIGRSINRMEQVLVRFLWKPLFVNESSDPQVHAKRPVLRNDWFNHEASRPQCLMTQDGSSPHRRAHRKISSAKAVQK